MDTRSSERDLRDLKRDAVVTMSVHEAADFVGHLIQYENLTFSVTIIRRHSELIDTATIALV